MHLDIPILTVFVLVFIGLILGNLPGLALDRTGIALLGAIAIIVMRELSIQDAVTSIDVSTIAILFSFMIISAQFYYSGFYTYISDRVERWSVSPQYLLLLIIFITGLSSAMLINDIVCLAMTPLIVRICMRKRLNPIPFLLGLACASNIGSALTLIGNPQNMLIGQMLHIPFAKYTLIALVPCLLGLFVTWFVIVLVSHRKWEHEKKEIEYENPQFDQWQSTKGVLAIAALLFIFFVFDIPREHVSLAAAGFLLLSRQMASQKMLGFIDWQLLVLFIGLFIVNGEFQKTGMMQMLMDYLGFNHHTESPPVIFVTSVVLANVISNVPSVMLLLPFAKSDYMGSLLALSSTLAGNMFIVGSLANIIVVTQAANLGVHINWKKHLAVGMPVALISLGITALWLLLLR